MATVSSTCEIVESAEEFGSMCKQDEKGGNSCLQNLSNKSSLEDDINRLFESLNVRNSSRSSGLLNEAGRESLRKNASKRPMRGGASPASSIGISEPLSLKQALRGLCISQASEMAAMKRLSKPINSPTLSEAGTIKRLYRAVVVEANGSGLPLNEGEGKVLEISLVSEGISSNTSKGVSESIQIPSTDSSHHEAHPSSSVKAKVPQLTIRKSSLVDKICPLETKSSGVEVNTEVGKVKSVEPSSLFDSGEKLAFNDLQDAAQVKLPPAKLTQSNGQKGNLDATSNLSSPLAPSASKRGNKSSINNPCFVMPVFGNKNFMKKKVKHESTSASCSSSPCTQKLGGVSGPRMDIIEKNCIPNGEGKEVEKDFPDSGTTDKRTEMNTTSADTGSSNIESTLTCSSRIKSLDNKADEVFRSREKGEFSQSSKSSIGDYRCSTSISETSNLSGSNRCGSRPHMSKDSRWEAIRSVQMQSGSINLKHFKLLKKLGCGDIGIVYLAELTSTNCLFALKVMDLEFLVKRKKMARAQTEKEIMQMLDHPFLPTLYSHFSTEKLSCLVMEYCPGGDLHVLRQKQPTRSFSEQAARFYVAEILLALEYLHMLGVVYRDLKPENILVREDGHIMLSDFDLSLRCAVIPTVVTSSSPDPEPTRKTSSPCTESSCIDPFCLHPSFQVPCFTPRLLSIATKGRKMKSDLAAQVSPLPQLVVEPTSARSNSFVGTHEYLAPEIIKGEGHGSAVDWWTYGIFLFELLYGKTPFKGPGNEETLTNVVSRSLKFPSSPVVSYHARDLIRGLLIKDPENRLGSAKGAAEIKHHPFFEGLNWALIRCAVPPELPRYFDIGVSANSTQTDVAKCKDFQNIEEQMEFEVF